MRVRRRRWSVAHNTSNRAVNNKNRNKTAVHVYVYRTVLERPECGQSSEQLEHNETKNGQEAIGGSVASVGVRWECCNCKPCVQVEPGRGAGSLVTRHSTPEPLETRLLGLPI